MFAFVLATALAGCGGFDVEKAERNLKNGIQMQGGGQVQAVDCPNKVPGGEGKTFNCVAVISDGRRLNVAVTRTDDSDGIVWRVGEAAAGATGSTGATGATPAATPGTTAQQGPGVAGTTGANESADEGPLKPFRNAAAGYSIQYPSGWTRKGSAKDTLLAFQNRFIHITAYKGGLTDTAATEAEVRKEKGKILIPAKRTRVGRGPAVFVTFQPAARGAEQKTTRYVISRAGNVALIDFGVSGDAPASWEARIRSIVDSFRWL